LDVVTDTTAENREYFMSALLPRNFGQEKEKVVVGTAIWDISLVNGMTNIHCLLNPKPYIAESTLFTEKGKRFQTRADT
jgi:hypothetical protein